VLKSALFTKLTLNAYGDPVKTTNPPENLEEDAYDRADIVSAALTKFDATLFGPDNKLRERAGTLRVNKIRVVDVFGIPREWDSKANPDDGTEQSGSAWWTELEPRLPFWGRLRFRLQAAHGDQDATPIDPGICGVLVPDFVEHTLEVFDGTGAALGELKSDPPRIGSPAGTKLDVRFTLHPWVRAALGLAEADDPFPHIPNETLRSLVRSIAAQSFTAPASGATGWNETGLTAMLRVIDTIRGTLDPSVATRDRRVQLMGEPILVLRARFELEGTTTSDLRQLTGDPPKVVAPPSLPTVPVRIGDATRPDDGVLGCFIPGPTPAAGRFGPVSAEAVSGAIVNVFTSHISDEIQVDPLKGLPATHPFVAERTSTFTVTPNDAQTYVILADPRGSLYATCGVLPRKKVTVPKEFVDAALRNVEPTIRIGPVVATMQAGATKVMVPPPQLEGYQAQFVSEHQGTFAEAPVSPVPPLAELPKERVMLTGGWMRMVRPPSA
jgi:hypothetical protein